MSLKGSAVAKELLKGKVNGADVIYMDTYKIAVMNGYEGTIEEWLESLKGEKGEKGEKGDPGETVDDTKVGDDPWSSRKLVDTLCPSVTETGKLVQITSIEGIPLTITGAFEGSLEVSVCGKNLYNKTAYPLDTNGYPYSNTTAPGTFSTSPNYRRTGFIPVSHLAGQTIVLSHCPNATNPGMSFYTRIPDVGNADDCKDAWCGGTAKESMIVPDNANYMVFCVKAADKDADVQIELGSVSTSYEPYVFTSGGAADDGEMPVIINALKGVNTIWAIDENGTDMPTNITVTGKADPVALIDKLMKTVFPATISNEEV